VDMLIFMSFYSESIWPNVISQWITVRGHQMFCRSQKKWDGNLGNDQKSIRGRYHVPYRGVWKSPNSLKPKKVWQMKSKDKSMLIICFEMMEIVHKEFILAGQIVNSAYCDVLQQLCEDFTLKFVDKITGCCITTICLIKNVTIIPTHPTHLTWPRDFSLFSTISTTQMR
jgi:hypothetical protein